MLLLEKYQQFNLSLRTMIILLFAFGNKCILEQMFALAGAECIFSTIVVVSPLRMKWQCIVDLQLTVSLASPE